MLVRSVLWGVLSKWTPILSSQNGPQALQVLIAFTGPHILHSTSELHTLV